MMTPEMTKLYCPLCELMLTPYSLCTCGGITLRQRLETLRDMLSEKEREVNYLTLLIAQIEEGLDG